ncbi:hypothetical protein NM208_g1711 [Fusarium decemcellulare]|uniref:Uncharacterized protein n=1 Tax=Fusarium decemcellulare TaxID=57161 RepID=A0ACC1SV79_9HYPO|nr:hypothetical protein NM208_g1711 [Fusarium decemcellulare]
MSSTSPRVAIVGGGLSGLASVNGLVEALGSDTLYVSITIFEPSSSVGPGLAYRIDQPYCWLLNHEADHLGTLNGGESGFLNWMRENREALSQEYAQAMERGWVPTNPVDGLISVDPKAFYPRSLFGRFLRYVFDTVKNDAERKSIQITVVNQGVHGIDDQSDGKLLLHDAEGTHHLFDQVVLCTGHTYGKPNPTFACRDTYVSNLYIRGERESVTAKQSSLEEPSRKPRHLGRVAVRGTGLSGNDAVLWLLEQRELGLIDYDEILMVSRRGLLRKTRVKVGVYQLQFLTPEILEAQVKVNGHISLEWLLPQIRQEMEAAYGGKKLDWQDIWNPRTADIGKHLEKSIKESASGQVVPWRSVMIALVNVRQYIFEHMVDEDKLRFFRELASLFYTYQAPMPAFSAIRLHEAIQSGMLKPEAGLSDIALDDMSGKYTLTFWTGKDGRPVLTHGLESHLPVDATKRQIKVDYLIDAMGQTRNFQNLQSPYPELFNAKLLRAYQWGGIQIDPRSRQPIKGDGQLWENVWQLGINSLGDLLIPVNAPNSIADGLDIGRRMAQELDKQQSSREPPTKTTSATVSAVQKAFGLMDKHSNTQQGPPPPTFPVRRVGYVAVEL